MSSQLNIPAAPPQPMGAGPGPGLPKDYGVTRLVLMPRDPGWMHAYWEVAPYTWAEVERLFGPGVVADGKPVLRSSLGENGKAWSFDLEVKVEARSWYVRVPSQPGRFRAELGLVLPDGRFALLAVSNEVWMPAGRVSLVEDEKWAALQAEWDRLCELSGGGRVAAGSLDTARAMAQHWEFINAGSSWPGGRG